MYYVLHISIKILFVDATGNTCSHASNIMCIAQLFFSGSLSSVSLRFLYGFLLTV